MKQFPKNFMWGATTAAHQVEGNNTNSDWWEWEQAGGGTEPSGAACQHYELYEKDFDLVQSLHHTAHRLSIEWSRIEPSEGSFSTDALSHYRKVIVALRKRDIEPIVTLHHFTNPLWFTQKGGWQNRRAHIYFVKYVERVVNDVGHLVHYWITINEPYIYSYYSYLCGDWPPEKKSFSQAMQVAHNLLKAHSAA